MKNEYEYSAFIGFITDNPVLVLYLPRTGRYTYRISSNNSRPSINRPTPQSLSASSVSPLFQVEVESDPAKLISDDSSSEN